MEFDRTFDKINKIKELEKEIEDWQKFALSIRDIINDEKRAERNYRSILHHIRVFFGIYKNQFELTVLNNKAGLLEINFDFAMKEIEKLKEEVIKL